MYSFLSLFILGFIKHNTVMFGPGFFFYKLYFTQVKFDSIRDQYLYYYMGPMSELQSTIRIYVLYI